MPCCMDWVQWRSCLFFRSNNVVVPARSQHQAAWRGSGRVEFENGLPWHVSTPSCPTVQPADAQRIQTGPHVLQSLLVSP